MKFAQIFNKNKLLILIIISGILVRIVFLFHHDLWFDESISILISRLPLPKLLSSASFDNNPPLYYLLLHYWGVLSQNTIWLRILSLIFSTATIPITYLLAKSFSNQRTANLTAALAAFMPVQLYYAGETRFYSLLILLSASLFYLAVRKNKNSKWQFPTHNILIIFLTSTLILTHYYGLLVVFFSIALTLKQSKIFQKNWILLTLIGFLFTFPWLIYSFPKPHPQPWLPSSLLSILFIPITATQGFTGIAPPSTLLRLPFLTILTITTLSLLSLWLILKQLNKHLLFAVLILITTILIISTFIPFLSPRLILPFTPFLYFLTAKTLSNKSTLKKAFLFFMFIAILLSFSPPLRGPRIKNAIRSSQTNNIPIFHTSISTYYPTLVNSPKTSHYYIGPPTFPKPFTQNIGGQPIDIRKLNKPQQFILLIDKNNTQSSILLNIKEQLNSTHHLTDEKAFDDFLISYYTLYTKP